MIPTGPRPAGELKPVELGYLTIDGIISVAGGGIALETRSRARLKNPDKQAPFERQVDFSGPAVSGVQIGTQSGGVSPAAGSGPWTLALPPEGDAVIEGTQRQSAQGPVVDLRLDWSAPRVWGARLGSVRLTLRFPDDLQSEQLLLVEPAPTERDAISLTWSYEAFSPGGGVRVLFIAPSYWRALTAARQSASILRNAGLEEFLVRDLEGYVERAVALALDPGTPRRLAALRREMRARLARSPLCDTAALARGLEQRYREFAASGPL